MTSPGAKGTGLMGSPGSPWKSQLQERCNLGGCKQRNIKARSSSHSHWQQPEKQEFESKEVLEQYGLT